MRHMLCNFYLNPDKLSMKNDILCYKDKIFKLKTNYINYKFYFCKFSIKRRNILEYKYIDYLFHFIKLYLCLECTQDIYQNYPHTFNILLHILYKKKKYKITLIKNVFFYTFAIFLTSFIITINTGTFIIRIKISIYCNTCLTCCTANTKITSKMTFFKK